MDGNLLRKRLFGCDKHETVSQVSFCYLFVKTKNIYTYYQNIIRKASFLM